MIQVGDVTRKNWRKKNAKSRKQHANTEALAFLYLDVRLRGNIMLQNFKTVEKKRLTAQRENEESEGRAIERGEVIRCPDMTKEQQPHIRKLEAMEMDKKGGWEKIKYVVVWVSVWAYFCARDQAYFQTPRGRGGFRPTPTHPGSEVTWEGGPEDPKIGVKKEKYHAFFKKISPSAGSKRVRGFLPWECRATCTTSGANNLRKSLQGMVGIFHGMNISALCEMWS